MLYSNKETKEMTGDDPIGLYPSVGSKIVGLFDCYWHRCCLLVIVGVLLGIVANDIVVWGYTHIDG